MADDNTTIPQKERARLADEALNNADCAALRHLLSNAEQDIVGLVGGLKVVLDTGKAVPRQSDEVVFAMRDVALAAIKFAEDASGKIMALYEATKD